MTAPTYPDVAAFLVANLDRLEVLAWSATDSDDEPRWTVDQEQEWDVDFTISPQVVCSGFDGGGVTSWQQASHIAQHDPAFVIADIASKRAVVSMFRWAVSPSKFKRAASLDYNLAVTRAMLVLRLFAAPFADQPGYRPEWAVG